MSIQKIIQESINGNPLEMKGALVEELRNRIALALQAKMSDEAELDEAFTAGDKVHWEDPDSGKHLTGTVHMAKGSRKGVARVKADGTHGSMWDVHHSHLNKMDEEAELDETIRYSSSEALKKDKEHGFYADEDDGYHHVFGAATGYSYGQHDNKSSAEKHARDLNKAHSPHIKESFEQLDEISKKTLASYVKKASDSRADASADKKDYKFGSPEYNMLKKSAQKRKAGISKAVDRLTKESFDLSDYTEEELEDFIMSEEFEQLDEISKKTLRSYITKTMDVHPPSSLTPLRDVERRKAEYQRRLKGFGTATDKLTGRAKVNPKESFNLSDLTLEELEDFMMSEEFEQLDEISKKTLASYVSKAADSAASKGVEYGTKKAQSDEMDRMMNRHMSYSDKDKIRQIMKTTNRDVEAPREKAAKRLKGIDRAVNKLSGRAKVNPKD
jgi:hypothetical protein